MAANGPARQWWIDNTGVAPAPGVPFPADSFPRYARAGARAEWNEAVKRAEQGDEGPEWAQFFPSYREYLRVRRINKDWSARHSKQFMSRYRAEKGAEWQKAYYDAYPNDPWEAFGLPRAAGVRKGSPWHKYFTVNIAGYMTEEQYDADYPMTGF